MSLEDYMIDPRPDLKVDTLRWRRLFHVVFLTIQDKQRALKVLENLWSFRAFGLTMHRDLSGIKLKPIIKPGWAWETPEEYEYWKNKYLVPYADEIKLLIRRIEQEVD